MSKSQRNSQSVNRLDSIILGSSEMSDVKHVASVAALRELPGRYEGQQISLTSYYAGWAAEVARPKGGGILTWAGSSEENDNGVTVFAVTGVTVGRWARIRGQSITPYDAGARGDGIADDSDAIEACTVSVGGVIDFTGGVFRTTRTISVPHKSTTFWADRLPRISINSNRYIESSAKIILDNDSVDYHFDVNAYDFMSRGVHYVGPLTGSYIQRPDNATGLFKLERLVGGLHPTSTIDADLRDNRIESYRSGVKIVGRGLKFSGNHVVNCKYGVELDWPDEHGSPPDHRGDMHGMRAWQILGNRFHGVLYQVTNRGWNRKNLNGLQMSNNLSDIGAGIYSGVLHQSSISGCDSLFSPETANSEVFDLWDGSTDFTISDIGIFGGVMEDGTVRTPRRCFAVQGEVRGRITNVRAGKYRRHFLLVASNSDVDITVDGVDIDFHNYENAVNPVFSISSNTTGRLRVNDINLNLSDTVNNSGGIIRASSANEVVFELGDYRISGDEMPVFGDGNVRCVGSTVLPVVSSGRVIAGAEFAGNLFISPTGGAGGEPCLVFNIGGVNKRIDISGDL